MVDWPKFLSAIQDGQRSEGRKMIQVSARWCSVSQARELIRQKISAGVKSGPSEMRRAFQFIDVDGSGHISYEEFVGTAKRNRMIFLSVHARVCLS